MDKLLTLLDNNARMPIAQLAAAAGCSPEEAEKRIASYEKQGLIKGYKTIIDWDRIDRDYVSARIELRVTPQRDMGFEEIAAQIASFEEVETVYLMSGSYDLAVTVAGHSLKQIAYFVASKLAPIPAVQSTSTSFVLRRYKERGILNPQVDEREDIL